MSSKRVTVYEAARALDLSVDAIRKRVQRGAIAYEKDDAGRVHILLDESETLQDEVRDTYGTSSGELLDQLREQNAYLRELLDAEREARTEENRRKDHIIAGLMQRVPELESSESSQEPRQQAPAGEPDPEPESQQAEAHSGTQRPWWKRWWRS